MVRVLNHLIGRIVEVYVDDIVVKSPTQTLHSQDLSEVFVALRS